MYIKTEGPPTAKLFIVGEAPGADEDYQGRPFVGAAGKVLNDMLKNVGISRAECLIGNVCKERPPGNSIDFFFEDRGKRQKPKDFLVEWIKLLKQEIETFKPNLVVALGDLAYWTLCGERGIMKARGYITESTLVPRQKVLPILHPAHVLRNWDKRFHCLCDFNKAKKHMEFPEIPKDNRTFITSISPRDFIQYIDYLKHEHRKPIAVDIETTRSNCNIDIIGIAESVDKAVSFGFMRSATESLYSPETEYKIWRALAELFQTKPVIMQNGKFDLSVLWAKNGVLIKNFIFDTMVACHVCFPEAPRSLEFLTSICADFPRWKQTSQAQPLLYNAQDCTNTYAVYEQLKQVIEEDNNFSLTFEREMRQNEIACMLEIQGCYVDKAVQTTILQENNLKISQLEQNLETAIGKKVNVKSPKQLSQLLYVDLGLPTQYKRRKSRFEDKKVTTDATAMKKLQQKVNNPILDTIMDLKKLYKLNTFIDIPTSPQSRVHTCYNITGANMTSMTASSQFIEDDSGDYKSFGRWSSSKSIIFPFGSGNLQNIPKKAREMYTVPDGFTLLQADYKQAEAVVVAYLINDRVLIDLFQKSFGKSNTECKENGWDVHKVTASMMFGIPLEKVTKDLRTVGKRLRHATNYSAGPGVLAVNLGIAISEAKNLLNLYHAGCPQLKIWHQQIQHKLKEDRTLVNLLGRKHIFMDRWGDNLFRSAYSFLPQSTVGDLLNLALTRLYYAHGNWLTIYLQLHDAIYVVVKTDLLSKAILAMREAMLIPLTHNDYEFTIDTDFSTGKSWGNMEEIEWQSYVS